MSLPRGTVALHVDYGEPSWREPSDGETQDARSMAGYAELTHDGGHLWVKFDGQHEIEMSTNGARIVAEALMAMADMLEGKA